MVHDVQARKATVVVIALIALAATTAHAQQQPQTPPIRIAASSYATTEVHINSRPIGKEWYEEDAALTGPARIAISYGQPHARGRKVEGGLIPQDKVWRFGANSATTLHTDVDLMLGELKVPRGDYTLFVQMGQSGWDLIVNHQTAQWGTDYDKAQDLGKVALKVRPLTDAEESLTIFLVPDSEKPQSGYAALQGVLKIKWGKTELSAPWTVVK